jgi:hypothetical protein
MEGEKGKTGGRLSLQPLTFDEAVSGLLQVKPKPKDKAQSKPKRATKKGKKK